MVTSTIKLYHKCTQFHKFCRIIYIYICLLFCLSWAQAFMLFFSSPHYHPCIVEFWQNWKHRGKVLAVKSRGDETSAESISGKYTSDAQDSRVACHGVCFMLRTVWVNGGAEPMWAWFTSYQLPTIKIAFGIVVRWGTDQWGSRDLLPFWIVW